MSLLKTPEEIAKLRRGGVLLSNILREIRAACIAGVGSDELDALARRRMAEMGGTPSFLEYRISPRDPGFPGALCVSINDEVVHGLPLPRRLIKEGDIVGLDIGMWYEGLATDMATTVIVGKVPERVRALVEDTRESLARALSVINSNGFISDIGAVIEDYLKPKKYGIVRDLVGHGVGHAVHEEPSIPNFRDPRSRRVKLQAGMVLAIEPMITLGDWHVRMKADGWTIVTADGSLSAHAEVTVAVTETGYELITPWPDV